MGRAPPAQGRRSRSEAGRASAAPDRAAARKAVRAGPGPDAFQALVEAAPFGVYLYRLDRAGRLLFVGANSAADRILGVENAAYVGKAIEEAFPGLAQTDVPARYREVIRTGVPWHAEQIRYEGHGIAGAFDVHAFRTAPEALAVAFADITERKRAEHALAAEKEHLAVTLRSIGDAVITADAAGRVILMNPVAEALTGWSAGEAAGRSLADVFRIAHEDSGSWIQDPLARALRQGKVGEDRVVLTSRDGVRRPIAESAATLHDARGGIAGVVVAFRDESAEREAQALLLESEARYRAVVRSVPVVQWAIDRRGIFTLSEGAGLTTLGLRPGQVVGWPIEEVYRDNPGVLADFQRALAGETFESENRIGPLIFESHWGPVRNDAGVIVGVTGIARDVTAERALREQSTRTQKLESLGRLAGGVAHDFNNLLTVILSCAELLQEQAAAGLPASRDDVEEIAAAGRRARDLVRQLLAVARKQAAAPEPTDLTAVLHGAEPLLRRVLGADVELGVEAQPELWPVLCDPGQLEQVFLNLALNARDAMPGGGRFTIRARNVGCPDVDGDCVRVEVRDTGRGMSEEVKNHVFEPFFTTKAPGEGTGLGLAIVYGVVSQIGGRIQVESAPGMGTAFTIFFPRCRRPAAPAAAPAVGRKAVGSETILVVDDDEFVRAVTTRALRAAGYHVLSAGDAREALAVAQQAADSLRLAITDVVMPGASGTAFARQLGERLPGVRVLFVSGYSREATAGRGLPEAGLSFLPKPFTSSALLERVRQVLESPQEGEPGPGGTASGGVPGARSGSTNGDPS